MKRLTGDAALWRAIRTANDAVKDVEDTASAVTITERWRAAFDTALQEVAA